MRLCPTFLLLPGLVVLSAAYAGAADSDPIDDVRVGVSAMLAPSIQERISAPDGKAANYDWKDLRSIETRFELMYLQGMSRRHRGLGGFVWGVGAVYGSNDITPGAYHTDAGGTTDNSRSDLSLRLREYGISVAAGLATAPQTTSMGALTWELLPILRGGFATAESVTPGFDTQVESGRSYFYEGELRGGVTLSDSNWLIGLHVGYLFSRAHFKIDMDDAGSSSLLIIRNGPTAGLDIGLRF